MIGRRQRRWLIAVEVVGVLVAAAVGVTLDIGLEDYQSNPPPDFAPLDNLAAVAVLSNSSLSPDQLAELASIVPPDLAREIARGISPTELAQISSTITAADIEKIRGMSPDEMWALYYRYMGEHGR